MIESRCGLVCSEFNCKELYGFECKGCAKEASAPWGVCDVKVCCEKKGLEHCGLCSNFPCELLKAFSYDKEHGDNGKRIVQCTSWKTGCSGCGR